MTKACPPGGADRMTLLDYASEILLLVDPRDLRIAQTSQAAERLLGYAPGELIGRAITDIECALSDVFFWEEVRQCGRGELRDAEGSYLCANGDILEASKSVFWLDGDPAWLVVRAEPNASRRKTEDELAYASSTLRATLEASADGILLIDRNGSVVNMNRRFSEMWRIPDAVLYEGDEAIRRHMAARCPDPEAFVAKAARLRTDSDAETLSTLRLTDGSVFECTSRPAWHGEQIIGRVYTYTDVTERHRTQQELIVAHDQAKAASRAKGDFLAMMSHEIRTPMNGIIGTSQLLELTPLNAEQAEYVRTIRASGEALLAIINDILDYSKIEAGRMSLESTGFRLSEMLRDIEQLFISRARETGVRLVSTCGEGVPDTLIGDPTRLRQILLNLVGNAFKFTSRGRIDLAVGALPRSGEVVELRFTVRDTGIGIAQDKIANIFHPFEQADHTTTRRYGGTGLGLSICRQLAGLMGGEIGVNSEEGRGSEFWFTVQLKTGKAESGEVRAGAAALAMLRADTRILLAEDNKVNQILLTKMLNKLGAQTVVVAGDGNEALRQCEMQLFDLIFMDARMPDMDGLEATCLLRQQGVTTRIIGCSADAMEDDRKAAMAAGMDDYLTKPVTIPALQAAITRWRESRRT